MFLWHHYFLVGFFHLLAIVLYDVIYDEQLFDGEPGLPLLIWLGWPIFDVVLLGLTIREWRNKK